MKKEISTKNAPAAIGPYSQAIEVNNMVYTSGMIPINPATGELVTGSVEEQAKQTFFEFKGFSRSFRIFYGKSSKNSCIY